MSITNNTASPQESAVNRRDFIHIAAGATGAVGAALAVWPFIHQMNPARDTLALATVEVDISSLEAGSAVLIKWRGKPVFIRHRTEEELTALNDVNVSQLPDRQTDAERALKGNEKFLVVVGVCTHLGCIPSGTNSGDVKGDFDGWFCPCHGSHYDASGRIRKGPAPRNLDVPVASLISDSVILIG